MKTSNRESPDARQKPMDGSHVETADSAWKLLYRIGGAAALIAGVFSVIEIIGVIATGPPPTTVIGWFTLLQHNQLRGLFDLFLLDMVATALFVPLFLALYVVLRRASPSLMALAAILAFVGIAVYFASNTPSRYFPSVTNMRLRQQMHRELNSWQQGRWRLLAWQKARARVSTWHSPSMPLPV